jgi:XTP/dITP diphosphohydrolase
LSARRRLLVATKNEGKVAELRRILADLDVELVSADELGLPDVEETGETFEANALLKARAQAAASGLMTIADDSGLEVDALGGAPGVHSARYAGHAGPGAAAANVRKLLTALEGVPDAARSARFRCVLALVDPEDPREGHAALAEGRCEGWVAREPSGHGGFGYDPIFLPEGMGCTMAELGDTEKDAISHRGRACAALRDQLTVHFATPRGSVSR